MRRLLVAALLLAAIATAAAAVGASGTVEGTIHFKSRVQRVHHSADPYGTAQPDVGSGAEPLNSVVFIETGRTEHFPPPRQHARIDQKNEAFVPHVLPILVGTDVDFYNSDPFYHNVFSLSPLKKFDLGRFPKGQRRSVGFGLVGTVHFDQPGVVPVFCEIHSHMSAYIVILTSPFFTVPQANGHFALHDVPPGHYRLRAWHDQLGERTAEVNVTAGGVTRCDLTF